jgi:NADPH2:quinone reductase
VIRFYKTGRSDVLKIEEIQLSRLKANEVFISDGLASELFSAKIDRVFVGLDEYAAAHRYVEANDQIGKIAVALSN